MEINQFIEEFNSGKVDFTRIMLPGIDLTGTDLIGVIFSEANLQKANLTFCYLNRAKFD